MDSWVTPLACRRHQRASDIIHSSASQTTEKDEIIAFIECFPSEWSSVIFIREHEVDASDSRTEPAIASIVRTTHVIPKASTSAYVGGRRL